MVPLASLNRTLPHVQEVVAAAAAAEVEAAAEEVVDMLHLSHNHDLNHGHSLCHNHDHNHDLSQHPNHHMVDNRAEEVEVGAEAEAAADGAAVVAVEAAEAEVAVTSRSDRVNWVEDFQTTNKSDFRP